MGQVSAANAHLHLWTVPEALDDGLWLLKAWGFRYASCLACAAEPTSDGAYWQQAYRYLLMGVRGKVAFRGTRIPSSITDRSIKPDSLRRLLERVSPRPSPRSVRHEGDGGMDPGRGRAAACKSSAATRLGAETDDEGGGVHRRVCLKCNSPFRRSTTPIISKTAASATTAVLDLPGYCEISSPNSCATLLTNSAALLWRRRLHPILKILAERA